MESVLVTGGSGFIGTNLIDLLLAKGYNRILNFDKNAPTNKEHQKFWIRGDIMNSNELETEFVNFQPNIIVHLAARTDTLSDKLQDYAENHEGTLNVLNIIKKTASIERVIITSTQYVYKSEEKPFPTEIDEFFPHTIYGASKVLTEKFTHEADLSCCWTIIRPTNIWGPWHMRYPNELWKVIDKGFYFHPVRHEVLRTYGYVKNVVYQIHQILLTSEEIVNRKMFYVGDTPIDSYLWLNEISLQLTNNKIKRLPKFIFQGIALFGDLLRAVKIPFPLYSKRFNNMIENYPAPTDITINHFGQAEENLSHNVKETVEWLQEEGKEYFQYWDRKVKK